MNYDIRKIIGKYLLPNISIIRENKKNNLIELLYKTWLILHKLEINWKQMRYKHIKGNSGNTWIIYD